MLEIKSRKAGSVHVFELNGEIDGVGLETFKSGLSEVTVEEKPKLVLDFSHVLFISSSGLGALVALYKKIKAQEGQLVIFGMRDVIRQVFEIVRLNKVINIVDSEDEALSSLG